MQSFTCYLTPQAGSRLSVPVSLPAADHCLIYGQVMEQGLPCPDALVLAISEATGIPEQWSITDVSGRVLSGTPNPRPGICAAGAEVRQRPGDFAHIAYSARSVPSFSVRRTIYYSVRLYIQKSSLHRLPGALEV